MALSAVARQNFCNALASKNDGEHVHNIMAQVSAADTTTAPAFAYGLTITTGGQTITAGSLTLTSGSLTLTSGNAVLTSGNLTLSSGVVSVTPAAASSTTVDIVGATLTTGKGIDLSDLNALTTGIGIHLASSATAITGAGRLLYSNHTGATGTSGILNEFATAATDETVLLKLTASAALALGKILNISGAAVTTGFGIDMSDLDALTTGTGMRIASNSADTGTRVLLQITNDNTAATGTTGLSIQNDATAGAHIKLTGTGVLGIDFTALGATDKLFDCTAASGCTAAPQTNAAVGFIGIKVGGTDQWIPYYNAT